MTDNIVERLRAGPCTVLTQREAADAIERLRAALDEYGDHKYECEMKDTWQCSCGYTAALRAARTNIALSDDPEKIANAALHQRADLMDEIERLRAIASDMLAVLNACRITIKNRDQRPDEMKLLDAIKIAIANAEDVLRVSR